MAAWRIGLAGLVMAGTAWGQMLRSADLLADAAVLRQAYEQLHPGLYRYSGKAEMDEKFAALGRALGKDQSLGEAYLAFSVFAAQVRCGHTYLNFFNQEKGVAEALFRGRNRVPFYFRWLDGRMVVTRDFTAGGKLPRGTEVVSINGVAVGEILKRLMTVARADGGNDAKRVSSMEVNGDSNYEAFDIYFPLLFPQKSTAMEVEVPGGVIVRIQEASYEERAAAVRIRARGDEVLFEWSYLEDGSAYLRMPTWALFNSKWDWKEWLNTRLDEAVKKKAPALVVDLRGNEGGNDVGDEILKRLVRSDVKGSGYRRLVRYRKTPAELNPYLDTWDASFRDWGGQAVAMEKALVTAPGVNYFELRREREEQVIHPEGRAFTGKLFVLTDASNSSATFQFAQVVRRNRLGTLVGQTTGGNQRGINGGAFFFLRLPKSRIEMDLPLMGYFPEEAQDDAGLVPDVYVEPGLGDVEMARVRELLKR